MTNRYQFVSYDTRLEHDHAVVRHEMGHALIAYYFGWQIGRVAFFRYSEGMLGGGVRIRQRTASTPVHKIQEESVIRLLAGDIAARKSLNLPLSHICIPDAESLELDLPHLRQIFGNRREDISKALCIAIDLHNADYLSKFLGYYDQAIQIVEDGWLGIQSASAHIEKRGLPTAANKQLLLPALEFIREFERHGVASRKIVAIEAVHRQLKGSFCTRIDRFVRVNFRKNLEIADDGENTPGIVLPNF